MLSPANIDRSTGVTYTSSQRRRTPAIPARVADRYANPGYDQPYTPGSATADRVSNRPAVTEPLPQLPTNQNPYGGVPGGGGGGGATPDWSSIYGLIGAGAPGQYSYTPQGQPEQFNYTPQGAPEQFNYTSLELPEYNAPEFYGWDQSQFDLASQAITDEINAGRASGNQTYADAFTELNQYQNPFGNVRTTNPGVRDAMSRMMQANGINPDINAQVDWEGQQADDAFGHTQALLAGTADQRQSSNLRALGGDQRRFNEGLDSQGRMLGTSVDLALAKARSQYEKDKFEYGEREARIRYEASAAQATANHTGINNAGMFNANQNNAVATANNQGLNSAGMFNVGQNNATATANNQGLNAVNQANVGGRNNWQQSVMGPIIDLLLSGDGGGIDMQQLLQAFQSTQPRSGGAVI